jgi:hypothetical protein
MLARCRQRVIELFASTQSLVLISISTTFEPPQNTWTRISGNSVHRRPNSWLRYVNFPVIFSGVGLIPPASAVNYVPWAIVGFIFQYVIRRRHFSWWTKYNYVLSASGFWCCHINSLHLFLVWILKSIILCTSQASDHCLLVVCSTLEMEPSVPTALANGGVSRYSYSKRMTTGNLVYLGNTVFLKNADALGTPLRTVAAGETFGPRTW